ncbi:TriK protein [Vibrio mediterranei AK1]|uniref:type IV secretory system conjugative DNA transfer family protein n=1 Tax=Vibrio mediterranei TaxID=689 RepID=UPI00015426FB|nr:type IV secretion system DNA-binding domain-containing protein [Vibrio mediterranei]EDL52173.1 TriK protein [Vibrio mediterranei AK1]
MLDRLEYQLYILAMNILSSLYVFTYHFGVVISFISGFIMPTIHFDKPEKNDQDTVLRRLFIALACLLFVFGTNSNWTVPALIDLTKKMYGVSPQAVHYPFSQWFLFPIFGAGILSHIYVRRAYAPLINRLKLKLTKKTEAAREARTDVRSVKELLPDTVHYDPEDFIDLDKGVFVGLDINQKPQYIPLAKIRKQHAGINGTTGAGKGVASGLILYQLILADEGVFVLDPKDDEWAPHLMKYACEKAGKPFHLINLNEEAPQLDLLAEAKPDQIEELLVAGFSFAEKGDLADFYRIDDRKAAREAPRRASEEERQSISALFHSDYVQGLEETVKAFYGKMEEMSLVEAINAPNGLSLNSVFKEGGCCYIIGSMRNSKILITQKMILIRLLQLAETRDRINEQPRPIAIFLDELKYHISKPAMEGLGAARDKGVHMFLAYQAVADLRDCPADLNGDAVVGAVVENTKFKLVYRLQDPDTAEWVAKMTGTILIDDETRNVETNSTLSEIVEGKRNIKQAERHLVDTNMWLNLPDFVSYIFTTDSVPRPSLISPIKVEKQTLEIYTPKHPDEFLFEEEAEPTPLTEEVESTTNLTEALSETIETELSETIVADEPTIDNEQEITLDTNPITPLAEINQDDTEQISEEVYKESLDKLSF